jgi:hypothetical protein
MYPSTDAWFFNFYICQCYEGGSKMYPNSAKRLPISDSQTARDIDLYILLYNTTTLTNVLT